MKIDSHQHFWDYSSAPQHYGWMDERHGALRRLFSPDHLWPLLQTSGYAGSIAVQARATPVDTSYLLGLAAQYPFILGVVGWLDLCAPDVERQLADATQNAKLRGLRMQIHDYDDNDFAASPAHVHGVSLLRNHNLTYDLLLRPQHLDAATRLVDQLPDQKFVVDHLAKRGHTDFDFWRARIVELSKRPNVCCKLSGLVTEANWTSWQRSEFAQVLDVVLNAFGAARCMIGSDWPVCTLAADYGTAIHIVEDHCSALSSAEKASIFGQACLNFYGLAAPSKAASSHNHYSAADASDPASDPASTLARQPTLDQP